MLQKQRELIGYPVILLQINTIRIFWISLKASSANSVAWFSWNRDTSISKATERWMACTGKGKDKCCEEIANNSVLVFSRIYTVVQWHSNPLASSGEGISPTGGLSVSLYHTYVPKRLELFPMGGLEFLFTVYFCPPIDLSFSPMEAKRCPMGAVSHCTPGTILLLEQVWREAKSDSDLEALSGKTKI